MANVTAVKTPSSLSTLGAAGMRRIIYSEKMRQDSVRPSVFTSPELAADFQLNSKGDIVIAKKGVLLNVENLGSEARSGQSVRASMRTGFRKRAQYGNASTENMKGNEDEGGLLWTEFFYNEVKKASRMFMYGYDFNDTEYLDLNGGDAKLHANFQAENDDTRYQQALIVQYDEGLTYAPTSKSPNFNPNWIFPNLAYSSNPTYDVSPAPTHSGNGYPDEDVDGYRSADTWSGATSFAYNVATAALQASGLAATPKAVYNVDHCSAITSHVQDYHMVEPIDMDGTVKWIWKVGPKTAGYMLNSAISGSFGAYFVSANIYANDLSRDIIPGELGTLFDHFVIVKDWRTPTMTVSGIGGGRTIALGYVRPSNNDDRNNGAWAATSGSENFVFELNSILGSNALAKYTRDDLKTGLTELEEYGRVRGNGCYKGEGIQLPIFDLDTPTGSSHIYRGSCIVPHSIATIDTVT